ncbi:MAG TPA: sugar phosphate isomerase/epimerase family protein [Clostridia bacterium]|nr:sugar phosphate isomerase/epimerase family protein [Clostridia bacterium]
MKVSTQTFHLQEVFGFEGAIDLISEVGFDAIDVSLDNTKRWEENVISRDDYIEYAGRLKEKAKKKGFFFNQAHAPFPSYKKDDEEYNKFTYYAIIRAMRFAAELGVKHIIIHPFNHENQKQANLDFFNNLLPYCKKYNIKIAIENMFGWDAKKGKTTSNVCSSAEELADFIDSLNSEYFVACLDVGHAGLAGENPADMIRTLGHDRLKALHIQDNDGVRDLHTMPYVSKIDFDSITSALKEIKYDGEFTLESDFFLIAFPKELKKDALTLMYKTAKHLAAKSE